VPALSTTRPFVPVGLLTNELLSNSDRITVGHCSGFAHRNAASVRKIQQTLAKESVNRKELTHPLSG